MFNHVFICSKKGPEFVLEDGKTIISLNEAIMWGKVTLFLPLNTGLKILELFTILGIFFKFVFKKKDASA